MKAKDLRSRGLDRRSLMQGGAAMLAAASLARVPAAVAAGQAASASAPTWKNWSGNLVHRPAADGVDYYFMFMPTSLGELQAMLAAVAAVPGATLRVSGQRHSQPPLVADDNRDAAPPTTTSYLVDMSCYADLGSGQEQIVLGPGKNQVTLNAGVREDALDAFLTRNDLMLKTATAGGFFSIGGMTAVDVHGGTVDAPIFAETASAFTIVLADGTVTTIDAQTPAAAGWSPLQFARVSLGALGIVTSVTLEVLDRPYATTLQGGVERYGIADKADFVKQFQPLLASHARLETFFTPYATYAVGIPLNAKNFLVLWWDRDETPAKKAANKPSPAPAPACAPAAPAQAYGAPTMGEVVEGIAQAVAQQAQYHDSPGNKAADILHPVDTATGPAVIAAGALDVIEQQVRRANKARAELWLAEAARVIFMSYYVPLPDLKAAGLAKVWDGLDVVSRIVLQDGSFHIAAPMEFRFVKGGDSALSGAYADQPNAWFVNLDLIGFVDETQKAAAYPAKLLQFFADVERAWVAMGGFPHNGKIFGFYDPTDAAGTYSRTGPFNPNFLAELRARRGNRLQAFNAYRRSLDPNGLFTNGYLRQLLEG